MMHHKSEHYMGAAIAIGVALGVALDNLAVGIALGVAVGAILSHQATRRNNDN
jgi:F0F1-type ATP synthase membrane subunit c/vacuolar-type H+-ATPase subunit K